MRCTWLVVALAASLACGAGRGGEVMPHPKAVSVGTMSNVDRTQLFVAVRDGADGSLQTVQFREELLEGGGVEPDFLKAVDWDVAVPADWAPIVGSAGLLRDDVGHFWSGWREPRALHALSLFHGNALRYGLAPGEQFAGRPVLLASGALTQYAWRPEGDAAALWAHVFSAGPETPPALASAATGRSASALPAASVAIPAPRAKEPRAALAWVLDGAAGLRLGAVHVGEGAPAALESDPVPALRAAPGQRVDLLAGLEPDGPLTAGVIARNAETGAYVWLLARFDFASGEVGVDATPLAVEPDSLVSGAPIFRKRYDKPSARILAREQGGRLLRIDPDSGTAVPFHPSVPEDYDYPLISSFEAAYEVELDASGRPRLNPIPR